MVVTARGIAVNGSLLPNSVAWVADKAGRPLPRMRLGSYAVAPGTVWLVSSYNPASLDSRYFGPVERDRIVGRLVPLWTR